MAGKNTAVFGIYKSIEHAESAVDRIIEAGFSNGDISVLLPDSRSSKEFAHEKNTKAPEGTTTGVATGGVVGGTLGLLAGIGALAIPGVGPFIAAGPIVGALAGLGVGGAACGCGGGAAGGVGGKWMRGRGSIWVALNSLSTLPALGSFWVSTLSGSMSGMIRGSILCRAGGCMMDSGTAMTNTTAAI